MRLEAEVPAGATSRLSARLRADREGLARVALLVAPLCGLAFGAIAWLGGRAELAGPAFALGTLPVLAALLVEIVSSLRRGDIGLDVVAGLSMTVALALDESLAAVVVALMYAGGRFLEGYAEQRASRTLTALLSRVPRVALVERAAGLAEVPVEAVVPGDRLMVRRGDLVAVDGEIALGVAVLDEAALTGESLPVQRAAGEAALSGSTNVGDAFTLIATRRASDSTYAGIVRMVAEARHSKAPMSRLADRYAMLFLAATVALAVAAWLASGDPVRALAVLVVATPCPLILAVPVAIISGVSRAAKVGVLVKGGKALETLAVVRVLVADKTGTLTHGRARLTEVEATPGLPDEALIRIAASLDQASPHIIAKALVDEARRRGLSLATPESVEEIPGDGVRGLVGGRRVAVGGPRFVARELGVPMPDAGPQHRPGAVIVAVAIDGRPAGRLAFADALRPDMAGFVRRLHELGIHRVVVASGDRREVTEMVVEDLGIDAVHAELTPESKVAVVQAERAGGPVMMIGDGVNDAPALAAADLGVAMGAAGAAASAEAADMVILVDDIERIVPAIRIARRARHIALESVIAGIGLSVAAMVVAALGYLTPVQGALIQEAIDVAVILNALRVLGGDPHRGPGAATASFRSDRPVPD